MRALLLTTLLVACGATIGRASDGFSYSLFNGRDLAGWHVTRCETGVEAGALVLKEGNGFVRTDHRYRDFVLELDWKARAKEKWDSGIYFRSELPGETGRPWPTRYQVNLAQGLEGNVKDLKGAASTGLVKPGEWNHFKLTVIGHKAELEINGRPAWRADGVEPADGYVGLQAEVPIGGQFEFRAIKITELDYVSLFDGRSLGGGPPRTSWEPALPARGRGGEVADGLIECTGERGTWLRSEKEYDDFNLRLAYKLKAGGNSGIYLRVPREGAHRGRELADGKPSGIEVQLLDDAAEKHKELAAYQYSGSIYAVVPATPRVSHPSGEWNTIEINCRGTNYRVTHNGVVVIDATAEKFPELANRETRGYLGLQDHSSPVWFRNIRVGPAQ